MANKVLLLFSIFLVLGTVLYLIQFGKEHSTQACILQTLDDNNIQGLVLSVDSNKFVIKGQTDQATKIKIQNLSFLHCTNQHVDTEITIKDNSQKHIAWLQFEIDEVNNIISITGKLKKQKQIKEVLAIFFDNFPNMTLAHDIQIDVLIKPNNSLMNHLSYILPSIKPIKRTRIKLTEDTLILEGLVRDEQREKLVLSMLDQLFNDEINIDNKLEKVIKDNNNIKPLEFSLPDVPAVEKGNTTQ